MKKLLLLAFVALFGFQAAKAQGIEVSIRNQQVKDSIFEFDVYMKSTGSAFYLGYADIVIDSLIKKTFGTDTVFANDAVFSYVTGSSAFINKDDNPIAATTIDGVVDVANFRTSSGANKGRLIINLNTVNFNFTQNDFDNLVPKITNDEKTHKLGTFRITKLNLYAFAPFHEFHDSGTGIKTKVYEIESSDPWNQSRVTGTLLSSFDFSSTPSSPVDTVWITNQATTSLTINWVEDGQNTSDSIILVMREYNLNAPSLTRSDSSVANGLKYSANADFGANVTDNTNGSTNSRIGISDTSYHVVYIGELDDSGSVQITGLTLGKSYAVTAYAFNGELGYSNTFSSGYFVVTSSVEDEPLWAVTTLFLTTTQADPTGGLTVTYTIDTTQQLDWDGKDSVVFVAFRSASIGVVPTDGKFYQASTTYASGDTIGATEAYVLGAYPARDFNEDTSFYKRTFAFSGLQADSLYYVRAIPFRANASVYSRNFRDLANSLERSRWTTPATLAGNDPTNQTTKDTVYQQADTALVIEFTAAANLNSSGNGRIVVVSENDPVSGSPINGYVYPANANFKLAPDFLDTTTTATSSQRVVYAGTGGAVTVGGLDPNRRYHIAVIEYGGQISRRNLVYIPEQAPATWARDNKHTWISISALAMLEGPYDAGADSMLLELRDATNDLLPTSQPFNTSAFGNYAGGETINLANYPTAVDWILLELRAANDTASATQASVQDNGNAYVSRRAALLLSDGKIVSPYNSGSDNDSLIFRTTTESQFYVVAYHRNHLPIMSDTAASIGSNFTIDLTTAANVIGSNGSGFKVEGSRVLMYAGNADNSDDVINAQDRAAINTDRNDVDVYAVSDVDLDRNVTAADLVRAWNNRDKTPVAKINE
ncbi:MAG: hypothetical protein ACK417_09270 [Bacteroidia bacterium]